MNLYVMIESLTVSQQQISNKINQLKHRYIKTLGHLIWNVAKSKARVFL